MKVADLQPKAPIDEITLNIIEKGDVREFQKFGKPGRVCSCKGKDEDGAEVTISLWNEDIDKVEVGDNIKITNGFCTEWQGNKQVSSGRQGKLEKI